MDELESLSETVNNEVHSSCHGNRCYCNSSVISVEDNKCSTENEAIKGDGNLGIVAAKKS